MNEDFGYRKNITDSARLTAFYICHIDNHLNHSSAFPSISEGSTSNEFIGVKEVK